MENKKYSFVKNINTYSTNNVQKISMTGILKPLSIGNINSIVKQDIGFLKKKINYQLNRIKMLEMDLTEQINNPKYITVQQKNKIDLRFLKEAEKIHKTYFNKILYYKNKTLTMNVVFLNTMQRGYQNMLFDLNQKYQKVKLELKGVLSNENPIRNSIQLQQVRV